MAQFEIGDKVRMPGIPLVVEVLEFGTCDDYPKIDCHPETFRFKDPQSGEDDWAHADEFVKVDAHYVTGHFDLDEATTRIRNSGFARSLTDAEAVGILRQPIHVAAVKQLTGRDLTAEQITARLAEVTA